MKSAKDDGEPSKGLDDLLKALAEQDHVFRYHVPPSVLGSSEEQIKNRIKYVYSQEQFLIADAEEVTKYARVGDEVVKAGDYTAAVLLKENSAGTVEKLTSKGVLVRFGKSRMDVHLDDLLVTSRTVKVGPIFGKEEKKLVYKDPTSATSFFAKGWNKRKVPEVKVFYKGETIYKGANIPEGTSGRIFGHRGDSYHIVWAALKDVQAETRKATDSYGSFRGYVGHPIFKSGDFHLVIPNEVDLPALCREHHVALD